MDQIEEVKNKTDIVSLISEFVPLKKTGRNFKGLCPFHSEKTPSFVVSFERQIFHCFGCQVGGDVFKFLMLIENIEFSEALRILANKAGVALVSYQPEAKTKLKEKIYKINDTAAQFYRYLLLHHSFGKEALSYLKNRNITQKTIELFGLGYAPPVWRGVSKYLIEKKGYLIEDLVSAGLCLTGNKYYDRFRGRLIFPLFDHRGNVVGFSGRLIADNQNNSTEGKYINSPETPVYSKSHHLFGLNLAKDFIKKENQAILVEGEFDLLSSYQYGIKNVVAIKGSALTEGHALLLKRFTENLLFALDADFAGNLAAVKGIEIAEQQGFNMRVVQLQAGKDPDECIRQNPGLWKKSLDKASPLYDYLLSSASSNNDPLSPEGKKNIGAFFLPFLNRISNEIIKSHYLKKLANLLSVSEESVYREIDRILRKEKVRRGVVVADLKSPESPISRQEKAETQLLSMLIQNPDFTNVLSLLKEILFPSDFQTPILSKIYSLFLENTENWEVTKFFASLPPEYLEVANKLYLFEYPKEEENGKEITTILKIGKSLHIENLKNKLKKLLTNLKKTKDEESDEEIKNLNSEIKKFTFELTSLG